MNLKLPNPNISDNPRIDIYDDATGKTVGYVKRIGEQSYMWDIDGCGGYEWSPEACLSKAQLEYDNQQLTARRQAETAELEYQSKADSGDYVAGLLSTLKRVSEELIAEYHRDTLRPAEIARRKAQLDKIKTELGE